MLSTILALALLAQTPQLWQVQDVTGQTWQCPDRQALIDHVQAINAKAAGRPEASPQGFTSGPGDPYNFGAWINSERARRGLSPLAHDPALSNDAAVNSSHGFGHFHMGRARRQNAGWGSGSQVWPMWISSPGHAAALFDPSITHYGIALVGPNWTFSAY